MFTSKRSWLVSVFAAMLLTFSLAAVGNAEARMGGSFGSRGGRTFSVPRATQTAPRPTAPIQNTMTNKQSTGVNGPAASVPRPRPSTGFWGGLGGGILGGLLFSGLFGSLFGFGFGGFGGGLAMIVQILLLVWLVSFVLKRFRQRPAMAGGYGNAYEAAPQPQGYGSGYGSAPAAGRNAQPDEIGISNRDLEAFEKRLQDVQTAFAREDHKALRRLATPEMVSFFSEELAENATRGVRNEVRDLRFLSGDVAEAWREGGREYATVAMNWSAIDVLVDRQTGAVVKGDPRTPVEATELWTFVRDRGGEWVLSAIQEAGR